MTTPEPLVPILLESMAMRVVTAPILRIAVNVPVADVNDVPVNVLLLSRAVTAAPELLIPTIVPAPEAVIVLPVTELLRINNKVGPPELRMPIIDPLVAVP